MKKFVLLLLVATLIVGGLLSVSCGPSPAEEPAKQGIAFAMIGDYTKAMDKFNEALELDPDYAMAYYCIGRCYHLQHQYDQAITAFNQAIELDSKIKEAYYERAECYLVTAMFELNRAAETDASLFEEEFDQVISDCTKAIKLDRDYAEAYMLRGVAYGIKEEFDQAYADLEKCLELAEDDAQLTRDAMDYLEMIEELEALSGS